jgi:hypothetical protein
MRQVFRLVARGGQRQAQRPLVVGGQDRGTEAAGVGHEIDGQGCAVEAAAARGAGAELVAEAAAALARWRLWMQPKPWLSVSTMVIFSFSCTAVTSSWLSIR